MIYYAIIRIMLYYIILYYIILYYIILYYIMLYYIISYYIIIMTHSYTLIYDTIICYMIIRLQAKVKADGVAEEKAYKDRRRDLKANKQLYNRQYLVYYFGYDTF